MKDIGLKIRAIRIEKGIEQKDLATKAGISHSYLSNVERGTRNPALKTLDKIAAALEVPANKLLENEQKGRNLTYLYLENIEKQKVREQHEEQEKKVILVKKIKAKLNLLDLRDLYLIESLIETMNKQ